VTAHRVPIILAAARNNVPAVYTQSEFVKDGGLLSYGFDQVDIWRRAATYIDRILRGEKPGDLPVQFPVKYELVLNLKTAKALGLTVPQSILLTADEVIEQGILQRKDVVACSRTCAKETSPPSRA
jgi:putative ABC transport system substrate-binding protein